MHLPMADMHKDTRTDRHPFMQTCINSGICAQIRTCAQSRTLTGMCTHVTCAHVSRDPLFPRALPGRAAHVSRRRKSATSLRTLRTPRTPHTLRTPPTLRRTACRSPQSGRPGRPPGQGRVASRRCRVIRAIGFAFTRRISLAFDHGSQTTNACPWPPTDSLISCLSLSHALRFFQ